MKRLGMAGILVTTALATGCGALLGLDDVELAGEGDGGSLVDGAVVTDGGGDAADDAQPPPGPDGGTSGTWGACGQNVLDACNAEETAEQAGCTVFIDLDAPAGGDGLSPATASNEVAAMYKLNPPPGKLRNICLTSGTYELGDKLDLTYESATIGIDGGWRRVEDGKDVQWKRDCRLEDPRMATVLRGNLLVLDTAAVRIANLSLAGGTSSNGASSSSHGLQLRGGSALLERVRIEAASGRAGVDAVEPSTPPISPSDASAALCDVTSPANPAGQPGDSAGSGRFEPNGYLPGDGAPGGQGEGGLPGRVVSAPQMLGDCENSCDAACSPVPTTVTGDPGQCGRGGAGGPGGPGGAGGGASLGVLAMDSRLTMVQTEVVTRSGGRGGDGASGGVGGVGSAGREGNQGPVCWARQMGRVACCDTGAEGCQHGNTTQACGGAPTPQFPKGGEGGTGEPGQQGLAGGGGAGGPSIAVALLEGSTLTAAVESNCLRWGQGGAGGRHGDPDRPSGAAGASGPRFPAAE